MPTTKTTRTKATKARNSGAATAVRGARKTAGSRVAASRNAVIAGTTATFGIPKLPKAITGTVRAAQGRQAQDVVILDLRKADGFTDYFVICTGTNARQIKAIADAITDALRNDFGERPVLSEGVHKSEWILLDYFNFVVHIFSSDCRAFYGLERLWGSAERYECDDTN